ncbi:MAG TPA: hypothetical protein PK082_05715 [Phycisphaerae bacterium]|nr:hypothetical protein [Phycisphaerae bacterium]
MHGLFSTTFVRRTLLTKGVVNALLGLIHLAGTFTFEAANIAGHGGPAEFHRDYLIWFSGVGAFILFLGLIDLLCARNLTASPSLARPVALLDAVFTLSLGLPGVIVFGISPPLVLLVTGTAGLLVLTLAQRKTAA